MSVWLLVLSLHANAAIFCGEALTSSIIEGREQIESTRLCVDNEQRPGASATVQAIASENCRSEHDEKTCLALAKAKEAQDLVVASRVAPPGFDLCLRLGGEPESIRFQMTALGVGIWHTTDRCRFDLDYSYLDTTSFSGRGPFKPR